MIERNAKAQTRLIEDMLDVSRIVTGKLTFNLETIDLATVIGAALDSVRPAAQAKNIQLVEHVDPTTSPIQGDAQRLQQVIWNLLSNAIKFTQPGGVVTIALQGSRTRVEVTVSDTGAGIRREVLPFVFDRFRQADSSTTRSHGGLGLGLAIVRHVIELHGGTVEADSAGEGKGATFRLELPVRDAWVPGGADRPAHGGRSTPRQPPGSRCFRAAGFWLSMIMPTPASSLAAFSRHPAPRSSRPPRAAKPSMPSRGRRPTC